VIKSGFKFRILWSDTFGLNTSAAQHNLQLADSWLLQTWDVWSAGPGVPRASNQPPVVHGTDIESHSPVTSWTTHCYQPWVGSVEPQATDTKPDTQLPKPDMQPRQPQQRHMNAAQLSPASAPADQQPGSRSNSRQDLLLQPPLSPATANLSVPAP
jgi:hypothetical protein